MTTRKIRLTREAFREPAALDTAVSRALLRQVAQGDEPETLRLYTPADVVAFGPQDTRAAGYGKATAAARAAGFEAIERLAGGRAAVFHSGTIAFSWTMPDTVPREDVMARFDEAADIMKQALRRLGIDARVGEVPGEYCPGQHSVNARGKRKLMGVGQRLIRGAAHVGGVVVVEGGDRIPSAASKTNLASPTTMRQPRQYSTNSPRDTRSTTEPCHPRLCDSRKNWSLSIWRPDSACRRVCSIRSVSFANESLQQLEYETHERGDEAATCNAD